MNNGYATVDAAACMGCGLYVSQCSQDAISLVRDPRWGEALKIRQLMASAVAE